MNSFYKYHAYGNAYTVLTCSDSGRSLTADQIRALCHPITGLGGDGLLLPQNLTHIDHVFPIRIFNPDGSEAEKSGNGLSIFAAYLNEQMGITSPPFTLETIGGNVIVTAVSPQNDTTTDVSLVIGRATVMPSSIPLTVENQDFIAYTVDIGNPHCVIFASLTPNQVRSYGPLIEHHPMFPNRTNVQFVRLIDRQNIEIEIWERGAGYTAASGSSASAVTAVCYMLGKIEAQVNLHMPGGSLPVSIDDQNQVTIHNTVHKIAQGTINLPDKDYRL